MISVIIPAYNEEKYLERTLRSLREQTIGSIEVVVVANGCTDSTVAIARRFADRIFAVDRPNVALARNIGAQHARGSLLVFLDADTRLAPNALAEIRRQFSAHDAVATLDAYPNAPKLRYHLLLAFKNLLHRARLYTGSSGVIATPASLFHQVHGFNPRMPIRENHALIRRLKKLGTYKVVRGTYAVTSMRRYERWGLLRALFFWLIHRWFVRPRTRYEAVR